MVVVRGDHRVNETKLTNTLGEPFRPASEDEIAERIGPPGFIGPVGAQVPVLLDGAVHAEGGWIAGANEPDHHLAGVQPGRDFAFEPVDVRTVEAGDPVNGQPITIEPAIEIGNIFQLGTRYSEPLGATYLDESGREQFVWMGSYGIGPARIVAAAVEQFADEQGISWPRSLAPWDVEIVGPRQAGQRRDRRRRGAARGAARRRTALAARRSRRAGRGRSSPTPSCSASRCGSRSGGDRSRRVRPRPRCGAA